MAVPHYYSPGTIGVFKYKVNKGKNYAKLESNATKKEKKTLDQVRYPSFSSLISRISVSLGTGALEE